MTLTARETITEAIYVQVAADDLVVADRGRASLLRQRFLEPLAIEPAKFVWIDLKMNVLTLGAAEELALRWLERVRSPRLPVIALFSCYARDVLTTLSTVLRSADQAAYAVNSSPFNEEPWLLGAVTDAQVETLAVLAGLSGHATSREFADTSAGKQNAALARLDAVYQKGLVRTEYDAAGARVYIYPLRRKPQGVIDQPRAGMRRMTPPRASGNGALKHSA